MDYVFNVFSYCYDILKYIINLYKGKFVMKLFDFEGIVLEGNIIRILFF